MELKKCLKAVRKISMESGSIWLELKINIKKTEKQFNGIENYHNRIKETPGIGKQLSWIQK